MIVSRAPVRLSMGGGGTDLPSYYERYGGFLMSATINKFVYLMVEKRFHRSIRLSYSKTEIVAHVDEIEHRIFREALKFAGIDNQIELVSLADVPSQCGLGTSSTFTVALLNALFVYKKNYLSLDELARAACRIEIELLREPIGKQDQYSAAYGGFNAYTFEKNGTVRVEPVGVSEERLLELQNNLFLFHLGKERSASDILAVQDKNVKEGGAGAAERLHKIKDLGLRTRKIMEGGKLDEFGELMHEHWLTKKKLSDKISDPFIDEAYELARSRGALGGKVVGAGGGGFLMVYCPRGRSALVEGMRKLGLEPTWFAFEREGAKVVFNG
jgi:D-glycero-alpha-D-manno-heptose-7-phosphate kinase